MKKRREEGRRDCEIYMLACLVAWPCIARDGGRPKSGVEATVIVPGFEERVDCCLLFVHLFMQLNRQC